MVKKIQNPNNQNSNKPLEQKPNNHQNLRQMLEPSLVTIEPNPATNATKRRQFVPNHNPPLYQT